MANLQAMHGYVVGIDAGGTSLRIQVFSRERQEIEASLTVPAAAEGGPEPLLAALPTLLAPPLSEAAITAVCAGITKISRTGVREHWEQALRERFPHARVEVVPDFVVAFQGAVPTGRGILLIAGTGSVVYGESGTGQAVRVGGRGWEFGDEGSGAHLTQDLVRRTVRACDGIYPPTPLTQAICKEAASDDAGVVAQWARQRAAQEGRGFLVPLVLAQARLGDSEARELFVGEAGWLARLVRTCWNQLGQESTAVFPVALVGGMWEAGELIRTPFEETVRRWLPQVHLTTPRFTPCDGAVRRAAR